MYLSSVPYLIMLGNSARYSLHDVLCVPLIQWLMWCAVPYNTQALAVFTILVITYTMPAKMNGLLNLLQPEAGRIQ